MRHLKYIVFVLSNRVFDMKSCFCGSVGSGLC